MKKKRISDSTKLWIIIFMMAGLLFAIFYVLFAIKLVYPEQIDCLTRIGQTKCSDFTKIVIVPDKVSDSGYLCASFPNMNNYPKFTTNELKSCGL